jgi:hypothetical protein
MKKYLLITVTCVLAFVLSCKKEPSIHPTLLSKTGGKHLENTEGEVRVLDNDRVLFPTVRQLDSTLELIALDSTHQEIVDFVDNMGHPSLLNYLDDNSITENREREAEALLNENYIFQLADKVIKIRTQDSSIWVVDHEQILEDPSVYEDLQEGTWNELFSNYHWDDDVLASIGLMSWSGCTQGAIGDCGWTDYDSNCQYFYNGWYRRWKNITTYNKVWGMYYRVRFEGRHEKNDGAGWVYSNAFNGDYNFSMVYEQIWIAYRQKCGNCATKYIANRPYGTNTNPYDNLYYSSTPLSSLKRAIRFRISSANSGGNRTSGTFTSTIYGLSSLQCY